MIIPIQNLYFLLCYAWDCLEEDKIVQVGQDECNTYADLFARVLETGVTHLLKRGLDRGYITEAEDTTSLRGKLDVSTTIKHNCLQHARAHCWFDSLSHDVLHNRIVKTTIGRLVRCTELSPDIRNRLLGVYRRLHDVSAIDLAPNLFSRVSLHRNNAFYGFLLHVCRLIYDSLLVDEKTGNAKFRDFVHDEKAMARLFEKFVRNFYRREQNRFQIRSDRIPWQDVAAQERDLRLLPKMRTDVSLVSFDRYIVLDTKYYVDSLTSFHGSEMVRSGNLYQLFAYLRNIQIAKAGKRQVEGILLYPTVSKSLDLRYVIHGHPIRVATVDLNTRCDQIRQRLLGLVGCLEEGEVSDGIGSSCKL